MIRINFSSELRSKRRLSHFISWSDTTYCNSNIKTQLSSKVARALFSGLRLNDENLPSCNSCSLQTNKSLTSLISNASKQSITSFDVTSTCTCSFSTNSNKHNANQNDSEIKRNETTSKKVTKSSDKELLSTTSISFIDNYIPSQFQPYARLARMDKPIGTALLLWPCYWSTAIAASPGMLPDPTLLGLFTVGAFTMRGAGCTINDMWDRDFDRNVTRTKTRPLASGEINMTQATAFLALQLGGGLGVLLSLPNTEYCFWLCSASLPLVATYPLMKRFTNWPQLVLGMTFNWGAFVGWAATYGSLNLPVVLPLYFSGVCWTIVYDTLYAHQDKKDDAKLGLKSTALYFAENTKPILYGFSGLTFLGWSMTGYALEYTSPIFYLGCGLGWTHLLWQIYTAELDNPDNLATRFRSNQQVGAIVFGSCILGNVTSGGFLF